MKQIRILSLRAFAQNLPLAVALLSFGATAETVTIDTAAGTTNRLQRVFTGETDLSINPGSTGGVVLPRPYSSFSGTTTLGSGTLVVTSPAREGGQGELGAYGPFIQTGGTLRYAGVQGGVWTRPITNSPASDTAAVVWQIDNDLTVSGNVWQPSGAFIKTGKGTLTLTENFKLGGGTTVLGEGIYKEIMDPSPDRAPTKGYGPFTIADGTVVVNSSDATNINVIGGADVNLAIGQGTTLTGTETTGTLIISNGITRSSGRINLGSSNGTKNNSTERLRPSILIRNGGILRCGTSESGSYTFYMGVQWYSGATQWNAPYLEIDGAGSKLACKGFHMSYSKGANCTVKVSNGGYLDSLNGHLYTCYNSSDTTTTNYFEMTGAGTWCRIQNFVNDSKNGGSCTTFRLADGATIEMRNFTNTAKGKLHFIVDGGVWRHRNNNNETPHFPSSMTSVKVGPGGMTTFFNNGSEAYPVIWEKGIEPLDDSGTDGGLHITQGESAMPPLRMNAANTYCGPTEISFTRVYLGKNGSLPSGTALSIYTSNGGLIITNGITQTVGSFTFGRDASTDSPFLGFGPNASLNVTGALHVGNRTSTPKFHLFEAQGVTNALATPGTYTFITAGKEYLSELVRLAGLASFPLKPDEVTYTCFADLSGDRACLRVTVTPAGSVPAASGDPLTLNNTDTASTLTATAEQIAAARTIYTNPGYPSNKHGPVELGALTGFANGGNLVVGNGMTYASDLSFANSVSNITIKFGSLAYTGGDATIPGITIESSENRSSVLNITNENTTLTIGEVNAVVGSLTKTGPGTLKLKPPVGATLTLPSDTQDAGDYNGVTEYGDGPSSGARAVNLDEGWTEIGTVGDSSDAPSIYAPVDFSVGSQSRRTGLPDQTAGSLRINNGTLYINSYLYIGYYCGNYAGNPDLNLTPTIEQNGGFLSCTVFRLGQCNSANQQTASPRYLLHGGTNIVRDAVNAGQSAVTKAHTYRALIDVDGGLMVVSNNFICGNNASAIGVDVSIRGNGRVEVGGDFYPAYNNTRDTNTFLLAGNGVLRAKAISGNNIARPLVATFNGGTFESVLPASGYTYIRYLNRAYIGAGGLNIDLSQHAEQEVRDNWLVTQQAFYHDPGCAGADGGITVRGRGSVALSTGLADGTFNGGIRATDGARVCFVYRHVAPFPVSVAPGCILHDYAGTNMVCDLTLGAAGATDPVTIEQLAGGKFLGFVVTNDLQILSPVTFTTVQEAHDFQPRLVAGVYTALVYNASCADVDLTLFGLTAADAELATLSAAQAVIADGGEFDGMKAVILTVSAKNGAGVVHGNAWASVTSGGSWSVADNWDNVTLVPNARDVEAYFKPATKANVGVTLDTPVTIGTLTLNGGAATYGYTLSGSALTLDSDDSTPAVANASGTNTIAAPITLAKTSLFRTAAGNELRVTGGISGPGNLNVNTHVATGAGQVNLKVDPAYAGVVKTGSGRVVMDDLSFVRDAGQLVLGLGTLRYTGPAVELPGITYAAGSARAAVFENDSDVTLNSLPFSGSSAFMKRGGGTLRLHGTGTFAPNTHRNLDLVNGFMSDNGDGPYGTTRGITVATGTFIQGEVDDPANAPTVNVDSHEIAIGSTGTQGDATYILNNGTFTSAAAFYLGYYSTSNVLSPRAVLSYIQNGGTLKVATFFACGYTNAKWNELADTRVEINGGTVWCGTHLFMGRDAVADRTKQTCRFTLNGGSFTTVGHTHLAYKEKTAKGYMDINGGVFTVSNGLYTAYGKNNDTTLRLNAGGTLRCNAVIAKSSGSTTRFYANGGEFRPLGLTAAALTMPAAAFTYLYASTNGLVVNTEELAAGGTYTLNPAVLHDPNCPATTDGGLTKRGAGILVLGGSNTYLGDTTVEEGILRISSGDGFASSKVTLTNSAFEVTSGAVTLRELAGYGSVSCEGLTVTNCLAPSAEDCFYASSNVTLRADVTLDLSAFEDGTFAVGDMLPLFVFGGTATAPETLRPTHTSAMRSQSSTVRTLVQGGVLYAVFSSGGTMLIVR